MNFQIRTVESCGNYDPLKLARDIAGSPVPSAIMLDVGYWLRVVWTSKAGQLEELVLTASNAGSQRKDGTLAFPYSSTRLPSLCHVWNVSFFGAISLEYRNGLRRQPRSLNLTPELQQWGRQLVFSKRILP